MIISFIFLLRNQWETPVSERPESGTWEASSAGQSVWMVDHKRHILFSLLSPNNLSTHKGQILTGMWVPGYLCHWYTINPKTNLLGCYVYPAPDPLSRPLQLLTSLWPRDSCPHSPSLCLSLLTNNLSPLIWASPCCLLCNILTLFILPNRNTLILPS